MDNSFSKLRMSIHGDSRTNNLSRTRGCDVDGPSLISNWSYRRTMSRDIMQTQSDPHYVVRFVKFSSSF